LEKDAQTKKAGGLRKLMTSYILILIIHSGRIKPRFPNHLGSQLRRGGAEDQQIRDRGQSVSVIIIGPGWNSCAWAKAPASLDLFEEPQKVKKREEERTSSSLWLESFTA